MEETVMGMTDKELADKSWRNRGLWYCVNANESSYKTAFSQDLKRAD